MTPSSFSRSSTAQPVQSPAYRQSRTPVARHSAGHSDHRDRATSNQRRSTNDVSRRLSRHSSTAPSSRNRHSSRNRQLPPTYSTTTTFDVLMPLFSAFVGILRPSPELLGAVDALRQQIADAVLALKSVSADVNAQPLVRWWCPCCRHHHDSTDCGALARVSPCKHCGGGHSNRSCPIRHEQVRARADVQPVEAQPSQLTANRGIAFGTFDAVPIHFSASQSAVEMREVARVERTGSVRTAALSTRTAAPPSPAADSVAQSPVVTLARGGDVASPGVDPESPATATADSDSSSVKARGERNDEQGERRNVVQGSTQTDPDEIAVSAVQTHDTMHPEGMPQSTADVPVESGVGLQGALDCVHSTAVQRRDRNRRQPGTPVLPVDLFPLGKGHQGCCSMRQCGQSFFGQDVCYIATLNPRSFNPFKGYYLCAQCRSSSEVYQQFFPHPVLLREPPDMVDAKRPNDLNCVYQTNQRNPGCCGKAGCGKLVKTILILTQV